MKRRNPRGADGLGKELLRSLSERKDYFGPPRTGHGGANYKSAMTAKGPSRLKDVDLEMRRQALKANDLYTSDYYRWAMETAAALRHNRVGDVDFQTVAEELEDLGRTEQRELRNRLKQLLLHVLKWKYQPGKRSDSWRASVNAQRKEIQRLLKDNPSLKVQVKALLTDAYSVAVDLAVSQTRLPYPTFPVECPFTYGDVISKDLDRL